jgi:hypothetical protein
MPWCSSGVGLILVVHAGHTIVGAEVTNLNMQATDQPNLSMTA